MAWCPKCKCEYVEGIAVCADCGCELVSSIHEAEEIPEGSSDSIKDEDLDIDTEEDLSKADDTLSEENTKVKSHRYVNNTEKAEDNKSSAYTLLLVGGIGFAGVLLFFFGLVPIQMSTFSRYMISGVMGVMFILFIIMGFVSMKNYKVFVKKAGKENNLTQEIRKWCSDNLTLQNVDASLQFEETTEEVKYFKRFEKLKQLIQNQFMNLDEAYLERLIDEIYPDIFEADKEPGM